jgi:hypothetical protein
MLTLRSQQAVRAEGFKKRQHEDASAARAGAGRAPKSSSGGHRGRYAQLESSSEDSG